MNKKDLKLLGEKKFDELHYQLLWAEVWERNIQDRKGSHINNDWIKRFCCIIWFLSENGKYCKQYQRDIRKMN